MAVLAKRMRQKMGKILILCLLGILQVLESRSIFLNMKQNAKCFGMSDFFYYRMNSLS